MQLETGIVVGDTRSWRYNTQPEIQSVTGDTCIWRYTKQLEIQCVAGDTLLLGYGVREMHSWYANVVGDTNRSWRYAQLEIQYMAGDTKRGWRYAPVGDTDGLVGN